MNNRKLNILLAEDNPISCKLAEINISKLGHKLDIVTNGLQAVEMYRSKRYDVILMDIEMPEMGGIAATRQIRNIEKETNVIKPVKIVAMTAHDADQFKYYIDNGMDICCIKPYRRNDLDKVLNE